MIEGVVSGRGRLTEALALFCRVAVAGLCPGFAVACAHLAPRLWHSGMPGARGYAVALGCAGATAVAWTIVVMGDLARHAVARRRRVGLELPYAVVEGCEDLDEPAYATPGASGLDVRAAVPADAPTTIPPGGCAAIPLGIMLAIPEGHEVQVRARSGLALRKRIGMANGIGTLDSDYRGVASAILLNAGDEDFVVHRGDRIAQLVLVRVERARLTRASRLGSTGRGAGGFGSTGTR